MWSLEQQLQYHLGSCQKCTFSGPNPDLMNQEPGGRAQQRGPDAVRGREPLSEVLRRAGGGVRVG